MKRLTEYKKNGYTFTITTRVRNYALAVGRKPGCSSPTFEVIEIQSHNGRDIAGQHFEPAEFPPSNEQWGTKGWTCATRDEAWELFETLIQTNQ